ncbi:MAG: zf-HC2 domain-containing protein [Actinomycetota bacterium]|nr:zf-HC2 domain-containing protein [Actinomycetota bacterium]
MPQTMRHEEVSEVLGDYVRGDLDAATRASVDEHLAGCKACTLELKAVATLSLEQAPLSDLERSRLHREVREQVAKAPSSERAGTPRRSWATRVAPGLGAAALLAVAAVGAASLFTGGDEGGQDGGGEAATAGRSLEEGLRDQGNQGEGGDEAQAKPEVAAKEGDATADQEGLVEEDSAPADTIRNSLEPTFELAAEPVAEGNLSRYASRTGFDGYRWEAEAGERSKADELFLVAELSRMAPKSVRDQVQACARRVRLERKGRVFATYGTLTKVGDRPSLVLGFIWQGPPHQRSGYMLWAWPRGSCERPLAYSASGDKR